MSLLEVFEMTTLAQSNCTPLTASSVALSGPEIARHLDEISQWHLVEKEGQQRLERVFKFKNFNEALAFTMKVGQEAEAQDHHPAILTEFGQVTVDWWTHKVKGLHMNDFIMSAKTDKLYSM
jgi:4a-hydroxytetrahydrobiopterin dehydratase